MRISNKEISGVVRYIERYKQIIIEDRLSEHNNLMAEIGWVKEVVPDTKILEIGTGIGQLPIICKMKGLYCKAIEISPQLVEFGLKFERENGVEPDIE